MRHPVEEIAKITAARERVINVVDAVSALGAFDLPMDAAGFDVLLTGSQKALMLPPGQAYIALSDKAWARTESADLPRFYCDLKREKKAQAGGETAWTPAITLTVGLVEALRMIKEEGLQQCFARHARLAEATRAAGVALGCALFAPDAPSPTVTAVRGPDGPRHRQARQAAARQVRRVDHRRPGRGEGQDLPRRPPRLLRHLRHPHVGGRASRWRSRIWA